MALELQGTYCGAELHFEVSATGEVSAIRVVNPTARTVRLAVGRTSGNGPMPARDVLPGTDQTIALPGNRRFSYTGLTQNWFVDAWPL